MGFDLTSPLPPPQLIAKTSRWSHSISIFIRLQLFAGKATCIRCITKQIPGRPSLRRSNPPHIKAEERVRAGMEANLRIRRPGPDPHKALVVHSNAHRLHRTDLGVQNVSHRHHIVQLLPKCSWNPPETIYLRDRIPPILYLLDVLFNLSAAGKNHVSCKRVNQALANVTALVGVYGFDKSPS